MKRILVAEDEKNIRMIIRDYLNKEGYEVVEASNGQMALMLMEKEKIDLAILDVMMPIVDGFTVCEHIKELRDIPIIFLTAKIQEEDEIRGFELRADDYVKKPFSPAVLVMRVKKLLEDSDTHKVSHTTLQYGQVVIDKEMMKVMIEGKEIELTAKEFQIIYYLASYPSVVLSRDKILDEVWGYDYAGDTRAVDTHIKKIRKALGEYAYMIRTVFGAGYKFEV